MYGGAGIDTMKGSVGDDKMYGGAGIDTMKGNAGNDTMYGGDGADRITGGKGDDKMTGGDGEDVFVFKAKHGQDTITDFNLRQDDIEIRAFLLRQHVAVDQVGNDTVLQYGKLYNHDGNGRTADEYSEITFEDMNLSQTLRELGITQADLDTFL
jgi:Ca2+-binding RTX toxin-like protein